MKKQLKERLNKNVTQLREGFKIIKPTLLKMELNTFKPQRQSCG